jgi:hypothetical protein
MAFPRMSEIRIPPATRLKVSGAQLFLDAKVVSGAVASTRIGLKANLA